MNGTCAGGTGAFIDQMATLAEHHARRAERARPDSTTRSTPSPPAAACLPRSDIQPLLNQGARKEDVAASILPGRRQPDHRGAGAGAARSRARCVYLGGPLTFLQRAARAAFDRDASDVDGHVARRTALYFVALGAAMSATRGRTPSTLSRAARTGYAPTPASGGYRRLPPLFADKAEYDAFAAPARARHRAATRSSPTYARPGLPRHRRRLAPPSRLVVMPRTSELLYTVLRLQQRQSRGRSCGEFWTRFIAHCPAACPSPAAP